jgi:hypothetical protein
LRIRSQSRHSARTVRTKRSATDLLLAPRPDDESGGQVHPVLEEVVLRIEADLDETGKRLRVRKRPEARLVDPALAADAYVRVRSSGRDADDCCGRERDRRDVPQEVEARVHGESYERGDRAGPDFV